MTAVVELAGVVDDLDAETYHRHPALSSSGARLLLPPGSPARFKHRRENPEPHKSAYDLGHAAHLQVLGVGPDVVVVDAADWRTKAAKEQRAYAYEIGAVPLLREQYEDVRRMADALAAHPFAGRLFAPAVGKAEQSLFWRDEQAAIDCRARLDWLPDPGRGRLIVADYKTAASADPATLRRTMFDHGYQVQHWWNLDALRALGISDDAAFVFVVQEKIAPYLVTVVELDADAARIGELQSRRARDVFVECTATGVWPGYASDVVSISPPRWLLSELEGQTW